MNNKIKRLKADETILVLVDFQERIMPAMDRGEETLAAASRLIRGCRTLGVPILVTQQYPKGLGVTVETVSKALTEPLAEGEAEASYVPSDKSTFSAMGEPDFAKRLLDSGRGTVLICGVETHVCVMQTALDILAVDGANYDVFLAVDAASSRKESDKATSIRRMKAAGVELTTSESALFELLVGAGRPGFKQISALVK